MKLYKAHFTLKVGTGGVVFGAYFRDVDFDWKIDQVTFEMANGPTEYAADPDSLSGTITASGLINLGTARNLMAGAVPGSEITVVDFSATQEVKNLLNLLGPWEPQAGGVKHGTRTPSEDRLTLFGTKRNAVAAWETANAPQSTVGGDPPTAGTSTAGGTTGGTGGGTGGGAPT